MLVTALIIYAVLAVAAGVGVIIGRIIDPK